jgi:hypothetical protein
MTKANGPATKEVGTLFEGISQVSLAAARPQPPPTLRPLSCASMAALLEAQNFHGFFNRLIPASSPMSSRYQHRLSGFYLRTIAPRSILHHVASSLPCPESLLHYLASCHRITTTSILYLSQLRSHYRQAYIRPPSIQPTLLSGDITPIPLEHAWSASAPDLSSLSRNYSPYHPDPTSTRPSSWSPLPLISKDIHALSLYVTCIAFMSTSLLSSSRLHC